MNKKNILALAGDFLAQSSAMFARRSTHDWKYPEHWTGIERGNFYRQYMLWAHNGDEERIEQEMKDNPFRYEVGPPDWAVASMLADILHKAATNINNEEQSETAD